MPESKVTMLEGRLRRRVRALGLRSIEAYCEHIFTAAELGEEATHLINAVTTNKTDFFREAKHFDYLRDTLLPSLVANGARTIRCWSAACSTGAEPYTLAMTIADFADRAGGPDFEILATDLDTDVLETARLGIYSAELVDPVPAPMRQKYVLVSRDRARKEVRIVPALRRKIGFGRLNLMDDRYPVGAPMDLIFCRNVLIYFDKPTQHKVVSRLCENLAVGGHLLLGHSESIAGFDLPLKQVANTIFKRI